MRKVSKRALLLGLGASASVALSGCMYEGPYSAGGYYSGDDYYYDGYYDGYYGPYAGGYWAIDGFFYYWLRDRYYRDDYRHFRRDNFPGSSRFRGDRDGPSRWSRHGRKAPQGYELPPAAHPPRQVPRQGGPRPGQQ